MGDVPVGDVPVTEPVDPAAIATARFAAGVATPFACPHDHTALRIVGATLACAGGHSFDRARGGHANLMLPGHRTSKDPGDSAAMVAARRAFLGSGAYAPLADAIAAEVAAQRATRIVESGCGEGYYLDHIARRAALDGWADMVTLAGIDISRHAVKAAVKRVPVPGAAIGWAVANARYLPFAPASIDLILCLFGFPVWEGFRAVQAAGGQVLLADPGPDHLIELREVIYRDVRRSPPPALGEAIAHGYQFADQTHVRFSADLTSQAHIQSLVAMTPHAFRLTRDGHAALLAIDQLTVTVDVVLRRLRLEV